MKKIYIVTALFFAMACNSKNEKTEEVRQDVISAEHVHLDSNQLAHTPIVLVQAKEKNISPIVKVNGLIDVPPQNMVSVSMPLGGYLKSTKLLPGMHFNKGEVIAIMQDPKYIELQQDFLIARSKLDLLKKEFERQKDLNASKASSDKVFQQAKEAYESESITYRSLTEKILLIGLNPDKLTEQTLSRNIPIYAPIAGFVSKVNVNIGKYVNPTDVLFELVNPEDIHLSLTIFEKDMENLYLGQKVIAYTNNHPEKKYPCEILLIGKDVGSDRSINVHCHFEKYDKTLVPGTYMNAELVGVGRNAIVIPDESVLHDGKNNYIFIAKTTGEYELVQVETGIVEGDEIEIISASGKDLTKEKIVSKGSYSLWMKMNNVAEE
ncbi:MAG: efflux RND transporter periplasmic adaptor subunit [Bacteroidia bacterium]|nr:efflux RND transporter periplasmic adaptor subunit [Bacteroidia bacterium]MCF8427285.1 efflux RND transporter periplasmic adaptor subunit [Bacteroidia bacterium]MCF8447417.1 efflux RND transporter periplasmic adaptor subunit [Bacteroidia bacterium]